MELSAPRILGIGVHLPSEERGNDYWATEVVDRWARSAARRRDQAAQRLQENPPEVERLILEAVVAEGDDPFRGARTRRVAAASTSALDMEAAAAEEAIRAAKVTKAEIGAVLTYSAIPDLLATNVATSVHHRLGLERHCLSVSVDAACNSFLAQMNLAGALLDSDKAKYVLLVQSSFVSRVLPFDQPHSTMFGDGATALVVSRSSKGGGTVAVANSTDGTLQGSLVATTTAGQWYDDGQIFLTPDDMDKARVVFQEAPDKARAACEECLQRANWSKDDVDFFACHQGTAWLRRVVQRYVGLERAAFVDTYAEFGSLVAANVPLVLALAQSRGALRSGSRVLMFSAGNGETISALAYQWD